MIKFLLGFLVGTLAAASYVKRQGQSGPGSSSSARTGGGVDEFSSAAHNPKPHEIDTEEDVVPEAKRQSVSTS